LWLALFASYGVSLYSSCGVRDVTECLKKLHKYFSSFKN
jgi:hypothetical protein